MFTGSLAAGLAGLTVSPSRGILIFSPIVLIAAAGALRAWRSPVTSDALLLVRYSSLAALVILLTYSKFIVWWGGHGFGPRYLTDAMPFLGVLLALGLSPLAERTSHVRIRHAVVNTLLSYSIFIQALGAFCWPSPWTLNDPPYRFRLWNWRNSEIVACIRNGPRLDPLAQRVFDRLGF